MVSLALEVKGVRPGEVVVVLADDDRMRELNLQHRGQDRTTDVLTFPAPETAFESLGDVVISEGFVRRGAAHRKVSLSQEATVLALHGALHLAGMEDEDPEDREEMLAEMERIAHLAGLKLEKGWMSMPYEEDSCPPKS